MALSDEVAHDKFEKSKTFDPSLEGESSPDLGRHYGARRPRHSQRRCNVLYESITAPGCGYDTGTAHSSGEIPFCRHDMATSREANIPYAARLRLPKMDPQTLSKQS